MTKYDNTDDGDDLVLEFRQDTNKYNHQHDITYDRYFEGYVEGVYTVLKLINDKLPYYDGISEGLNQAIKLFEKYKNDSQNSRSRY